MNYQQILEAGFDYFESSSIFIDFARWVGWGIIMVLKALMDVVQPIFDAAFDSLDFLLYGKYLDFLGDFKILFVSIATLSFLILGIILIVSDRKPPVLKNILISVIFLAVLPMVTKMGVDIIKIGKTSMLGDSMVSANILSANITDLAYVANNNFENFDLTPPAIEKNPELLTNIDINEHMDPDDFDTQLQKDVLNHCRTLNKNGILTYEKFKKSGPLGLFGKPYYYRYSWHPFQIAMLLIANALVLFFTAYAVVRLVWEIVFSVIFGNLFAMEITSGEKLKKSIEGMFHGFITLFAVIMGLKIYYLFQSFVNSKWTDANDYGIRIALILFASLIVCDGPNIVERITGFDMGMKSGVSKVQAFMQLYQQHKMQKNFKHSAKEAKREFWDSFKKNPEPGKPSGPNPGGRAEPRRDSTTSGGHQEPGRASATSGSRAEPIGKSNSINRAQPNSENASKIAKNSNSKIGTSPDNMRINGKNATNSTFDKKGAVEASNELAKNKVNDNSATQDENLNSEELSKPMKNPSYENDSNPDNMRLESENATNSIFDKKDELHPTIGAFMDNLSNHELPEFSQQNSDASDALRPMQTSNNENGIHTGNARMGSKNAAGNKPAPEVKKSYGTFGNVRLSDEEIQKLKQEYPKDYLQKIDNLSTYMESRGKDYSNHYATIKNWDLNKKQEDQTQAQKSSRQKGKHGYIERDYDPDELARMLIDNDRDYSSIKTQAKEEYQNLSPEEKQELSKRWGFSSDD